MILNYAVVKICELVNDFNIFELNEKKKNKIK